MAGEGKLGEETIEKAIADPLKVIGHLPENID